MVDIVRTLRRQHVIKLLVYANVLVFAAVTAVPSLFDWLALHAADVWPWQPLTALFCHTGLTALLYGLASLWYFGRPLEERLGENEFLAYFFWCGGVTNMIWLAFVWLVFPAGTKAVTCGLTGVVFGLLFWFAWLWPDREVPFLMGPVRASTLVLVNTAIALYLAVTSPRGGIDEVFNLSGLLAGALYVDLRDDGAVRHRLIRWVRSYAGDAGKRAS